MTYHFVNILTWKFFLNKCLNPRTLFVDGFLLQLLLLIVTGKIYPKKSGLIFFQNMSWNDDNVIFLTQDGTFGFSNEYKLPMWEDVSNVELKDDIIEQIKNFETIVIGISSTKQDVLAYRIAEFFPDKNVYCLGAAIYSKPLVNSEFVVFTFLSMLINNPQRTIKKLILSLKVLLGDLMSKRKMLLRFAALLG